MVNKIAPEEYFANLGLAGYERPIATDFDFIN
jgi:hypothetical protein